MSGAEPQGVRPQCRMPSLCGEDGCVPTTQTPVLPGRALEFIIFLESLQGQGAPSGHRGCGSSGSDLGAAIPPQCWAIFTQWNYETGDMGWVVALP